MFDTIEQHRTEYVPYAKTINITENRIEDEYDVDSIIHFENSRDIETTVKKIINKI